ncbi:retrovirus-related pol polyprotein from transposon TNT 1-94 [Tanacetum coccineum]|uniref:Retrovirus-related pol polyprotein from transposon TNT 1-94 n=1 Tax=Tanacetum coccineum TaxID=301880 RepID=A0ABQ4Z6Y8_9ASTR
MTIFVPAPPTDPPNALYGSRRWWIHGYPSLFSMRIHHGGYFTDLPKRKYINGKENIVDVSDIEELSVYEVDSIMKQLGYNEIVEPIYYHFLIPGKDLDVGLEALGNEDDVLNFSKYIANHELIELYTEQGVTKLNTSFMSPKANRLTIEEIVDEVIWSAVTSGFARFNTIITSLKALDEGFSSKNYVRKFLKALHPKWRAKIALAGAAGVNVVWLRGLGVGLSPPPTKLSPLVDDDVGEEEAIKKNSKVVNNNNEEDESIEVDKTVNIKESKNHPLDQVIGNLNQRTLRSQAQNHSNFFCFISTIEPKDVKEALKDECWVVAMQEELNQFVANDVWELVPLPMSQSVIGIKWVFRNKLDENGIVSRNKARLVAQGYNQQEGIDYDETYAPVARLESIIILLAIARANDFKLYQMDVKSAFLNGFINEEVYVAQPPGFIDFQKPNYVYKLKKALYGLKQAPKAWYDRLKAFLIKHEYSIGMVDDTLFTKKSKSHLIIVQIYVDNIISGSTSQNLCDDFAKIMHDEFEMSMMGDLNFLCLQIKQMEDRIFSINPSTSKRC